MPVHDTLPTSQWTLLTHYLVTISGLRHCLKMLMGRESLMTGWKLSSLGYRSIGDSVPTR